MFWQKCVKHRVQQAVAHANICRCWHFCQYLLHVLVGYFYGSVHLKVIWEEFWCSFELLTKLLNWPSVQIGSIIYYEPFQDTIAKYDVFLDESSYYCLGNIFLRWNFFPLGAVVYCHQDVFVPICNFWCNNPNDIYNPCWERPRQG